MLKFLLGAAVGYVLGAKAGHRRYEQLKRTYQRVSDHPAVQGAAGVVRARVEEDGARRSRPLTATAARPSMLELVGIRRKSLLDVVGNH